MEADAQAASHSTMPTQGSPASNPIKDLNKACDDQEFTVLVVIVWLMLAAASCCGRTSSLFSRESSAMEEWSVLEGFFGIFGGSIYFFLLSNASCKVSSSGREGDGMEIPDCLFEDLLTSSRERASALAVHPGLPTKYYVLGDGWLVVVFYTRN